jgi:coenzyme F420-dependent glucose-6-phosphate dehydrogenase
MRRLWSEDFVAYEGEYFRTRDATVYDKPAGGVPLYIAGSGAQAARLAGRAGDGFICTSGKPMELYAETLLPAVEQGAAEAGRDANQIERMIEMKVSFDVDRQRALEDTREWAALALSPEEKVGVEDPREMERLAQALPLERAASRWLVSDDPDDQVAKIKPYLELGFTHLVFHAPGPDQQRFLDLYSEHVLPRLRRAANDRP